MRGSEDYLDFENPFAFEKEPVYVSTLYDVVQEGGKDIFKYKSSDSQQDLVVVYNLYVDSCLENGVDPLPIEALSMSTIREVEQGDPSN